MALNDYTIQESDFTNKDVASLENQYVGQATALKAAFDKSVKEVAVPSINGIISTLSGVTDGNSGADNVKITPISGMDATSTQEALEELKTSVVNDLTTGGIAVPLSAEQGKNLKSYLNNLWIPVVDSWTYASAFTITVPSGAASLYQKGDMIKLTQTTVKYFYVIGVADTVLTVTGGADYSVANAAISAIYVAKGGNPQGFPLHGFSLGAPTWTSTGTAFTNQPINNVWYLKISNGVATIRGQAQCHATSGATGMLIATFTAGYIPTPAFIGYGIAANNSAFDSGYSYINALNEMRFLKYTSGTLATNSQYFGGECSYRY